MNIFEAIDKLISFYIKYDGTMVEKATTLRDSIYPKFDKGDIVRSKITNYTYTIFYREFNIDDMCLYYYPIGMDYGYTADDLELVKKAKPKS